MSTVNTRLLSAVSSGSEARPGTLDASSAVPATEMKFCAIEDPGGEACQ